MGLGDLRLNTFALLTGVALFLVLSRRSQPDGQETRDTLMPVGLFGFALVPITGNDMVPEETSRDSLSERRGDGIRSCYQNSTNDGLPLISGSICWPGNAK